MALNLLLATGTVAIKGDTKAIDTALADTKRKLLKFPTTIPVKFTADTKGLEQGILRAHGQIRTLRNAAGRPLRLTLNLQSGQFAGQASAIGQLKTMLRQPVTIRIRGDARDFASKAAKVWAILQTLRRGVAVNMTANPSQLNSGLTQIENRLKKLQGMARLRFTASGLGGLGGGGGGIGMGMGVHSLMSSMGMGSLAGPLMTAAANPALGAAEAAGMAAVSTARVAIDFEQQFKTLGRVSGLAADDVKRLKESLFALSMVQPGVAVEDLVQMATIGARAGVADKGGMQGLLDFTAALAKVKTVIPEMETENLSNSIIRVLNAMDEGIDKTEGFGSALVALDNISTASSQDILAISTNLAGTARSIGLTVPQVLALSSVLRDVGLTPQLAGSSFQQIFRKMASDSKAFAQEIGVDAEKFADAYRGDPMKALQMVIDKLHEVKDTVQGQELLSNLGLRGQRVGGALQQLASKFPEVEKRTKLAEDEAKSGSALQKGQEAMESTGGALTKLINSVKVLADALGQPLLKPIKDVSQGLVNLAAFLKGEGIGGKAMKAVTTFAGQEFDKATLPFRVVTGQVSKKELVNRLSTFSTGIMGKRTSQGITDFLARQGISLEEKAPPPKKALPGFKERNPNPVPAAPKDEATARREAREAALQALKDRKKQEKEEAALAAEKHELMVAGFKKMLKDNPKLEAAVSVGGLKLREAAQLGQAAKQGGLQILGALADRLVAKPGSATAELAKQRRIDQGRARPEEMPARQLQIHEGGMELARSLQQSILQRQEELGRLQVKALQENTDSNRKLDITVKDVIGNIGKQIGRLGSRE